MKVVLELLLLAMMGGVLLLMIMLHFAAPENVVNQELRPLLLRYPAITNLMQLHRVGDARYRLAAADPLTITVLYDPATPPHPNIKAWLEEIIQQTLQRSAVVTLQTDAGLPLNQLTNVQMSQLLKAPRATAIRIFYLASAQSAPTNAGQAPTDSDIFIFTVPIKSLSERDTIRAKVEKSTLMHEIGHLLGLDHVNKENCVMNEKVEVYGNERFQSANLPMTYCQEELWQLKTLLQ